MVSGGAMLLSLLVLKVMHPKESQEPYQLTCVYYIFKEPPQKIQKYKYLYLLHNNRRFQGQLSCFYCILFLTVVLLSAHFALHLLQKHLGISLYDICTYESELNVEYLLTVQRLMYFGTLGVA